MKEEKLEEAKRLYESANADQRYVLESLFPELKEPEDEEVRKALVDLVKCNERSGYTLLNNVSTSSMLAWLERQGNNINCIYDKELSELLHIVICRYINDSNISYPERENVSKKILPYVELLEKQGESYTKKDVDDAWLKGMCDAKNELEKQGDSLIKWNKNTKDNKPQVNHSVLMKTIYGIAEGEWQGEYWHQYRWAGLVRDIDVLSWMELSDLEKQGEQKPFDYEHANIQQKDFAPKVEPKFKVGDKIIRSSKSSCPVHDSTDDTICKVAEIHNTCYILDTKEGKVQEPFIWQDYYELVEPKTTWSERMKRNLKITFLPISALVTSILKEQNTML